MLKAHVVQLVDKLLLYRREKGEKRRIHRHYQRSLEIAVQQVLVRAIDFGPFAMMMESRRLDEARIIAYLTPFNIYSPTSDATEFVNLFVKAHKKTQGLYLHMLAAHIGEMYLQWGDLRPFQAQGLEHCHSKRKRAGLRLTNRKKGQRHVCFLKVLLYSPYYLIIFRRL